MYVTWVYYNLLRQSHLNAQIFVLFPKQEELKEPEKPGTRNKVDK